MKILWIPHTGWHIPQRAHLFCRALSEHHEIHVTDWIADFTTIRDYISLKYLRNFIYRKTMDGAITIHGIPRISPALFSARLRQLNTDLFLRHINRIIHEYQIDVVVGTFLTPPPVAAPALVYDMVDDNVGLWESYGRDQTYLKEIINNETAYIKTAAAVTVVSTVLRDKVLAQQPVGSVHHIPNGVAIDQFDHLNAAYKPFPNKGKLVGTVGNQDKAVELDKIIDAAKLLADEDITLLIAGRGSAVPQAKERVQRENITNVIFEGYIPPQKVAQLVAQLDVGLCPYMKNPGQDACSPMRLLVYTAAGIPVVCTDLEEVSRMQLPNVVLVKEDSAALAEGIRKALTLPRQRPQQIYEYEVGHLVEKYEMLLSEVVRQPSKGGVRSNK